MDSLLWKLVAVAVLSGLVGYKATAVIYGPEIAALKQQVKTAQDATDKANDRANGFKKSYEDLAATTKQQNDAVQKTVAAALEREQQAQVAIAKARADSKGYQAKAAAILLSKPPAGADECVAARDAFDLELKAERGK